MPPQYPREHNRSSSIASFRFVSFRFVSFHFVAFRFISFRFLCVSHLFSLHFRRGSVLFLPVILCRAAIGDIIDDEDLDEDSDSRSALSVAGR